MSNNTEGQHLITASEYARFQRQIESEGELEESYEIFEIQNTEISDLKASVENLERGLNQLRADGAEHCKTDGEPKWKRFKSLYYSELETDDQGNLRYDAAGRVIPVRIALEKNIIELTSKLHIPVSK